MASRWESASLVTPQTTQVSGAAICALEVFEFDLACQLTAAAFVDLRCVAFLAAGTSSHLAMTDSRQWMCSAAGRSTSWQSEALSRACAQVSVMHRYVQMKGTYRPDTVLEVSRRQIPPSHLRCYVLDQSVTQHRLCRLHLSVLGGLHSSAACITRPPLCSLLSPQVSEHISTFVSTAEAAVRDILPEQVSVPSVTELSREAFVAGVSNTQAVRDHIKVRAIWRRGKRSGQIQYL